MTRRKQSRGNCAFCGREMTKGGLSRHLKSCAKRREANANANGRSQTLYHLAVHDAYISDFWLHLEMNGRAALQDLDNYLRAIWLECCGHMSQFSFGSWSGREISMSCKIETVLSPGGAELTHIYDFGTSSETLIKAVAVREGKPLTNNPIYLMARNNLPSAVCDECGAEAGWYCVDCLVEQGEWITLCEKHLAIHNHADYGGPSPLINSPRLGMCSYNGPAEPPY